MYLSKQYYYKEWITHIKSSKYIVNKVIFLSNRVSVSDAGTLPALGVFVKFLNRPNRKIFKSTNIWLKQKR